MDINENISFYTLKSELWIMSREKVLARIITMPGFWIGFVWSAPKFA